MIEANAYHKPLELGEFDNFSGKAKVAYGKNWFEVIQDGDVLTIAILAKTKRSKKVSVEVIDTKDKQLFIFSSCEWDKDIVLESIEGINHKNKSKIDVNLLILESKSEKDSIAESMKTLEPFLKKEMEDSLSKKTATKKYIEKFYPEFFFKSLGENLISHIDAQLRTVSDNMEFLRVEALLDIRSES